MGLHEWSLVVKAFDEWRFAPEVIAIIFYYLMLVLRMFLGFADLR